MEFICIALSILSAFLVTHRRADAAIYISREGERRLHGWSFCLVNARAMQTTPYDRDIASSVLTQGTLIIRPPLSSSLSSWLVLHNSQYNRSAAIPSRRQFDYNDGVRICKRNYQLSYMHSK